MNPGNTISVIIPTYNGKATIISCINSLYDQTLKPKEVIVVDNGSKDNIQGVIKKRFPKVRIIKLDRNTGVTGGRNAGIENVNRKNKYILFFDHDMVAGKNMVKNLVNVAQKNSSFGIITPKIYYWEDKNRIWAAGTNINLWTGQVLFRGGKDNGQFEEEEEVQVAPAAFLVKKKVLDKINEFDNRYFATYEDTDFCFRAKKNGFKTIYTPKALAFHKISPKPQLEKKRLLDRSFWIGRNRILFMGSYGKNFYLFLFFSQIYLFYFIILAIRQKDMKGFLGYLNGVIVGVVEELITKRILINLPYTMYNILSNLIGGSGKTVLDVACGDGLPMQIMNANHRWKVTGIDIYKPYVDIARQRGVYENVYTGDIRKLDSIFKGKKFDVILCSSVLDHLTKKDSIEVIKQCEKLGREIIFSGLPNGFEEKHEAYFWEGNNPYQEHKSHWHLEEFESRGYSIRGFGSRVFIGERRLSERKSISSIKSIVVFLENLLAYLVAPVTYYFPKTSVCFMAIKESSKK